MSITGMGYGLPSYGLYGPQSQLDASLSNLGSSGASSPLSGTSALYSSGGSPMSGLYDATGGSGLSGSDGIMGMVMQIMNLIVSMLSTFMGGGAGLANPQSLLASPSGATGTTGTTGTGVNANDEGATENPDPTADPTGDPASADPTADPTGDPTGDPENTDAGNDHGGCHHGQTDPSTDPTGDPGGADPNADPTGDPGNTDPNADPTGNPGNMNLVVDPGASAAGGGSTPSKTGNADMDRWDSQIEAAAQSTGLPANYLKATMWAESRGNPDDPSQNPDGQHTDEGVMQISDYTYGDVMASQPNAPKGLTAGNQADNIMMGAWELKDKSEKAGGDLHATSVAYVGHGDSSDNTYADNVMMYMNELNNNQPLTDN